MEIENLEQDTQLEREEREQEILLSPEFYGDIGDGKLTIQKNGTDIGTFSANQKDDTTVNVTVPVSTSELNNDANFQNANDLSNAISNHNQSTSAHQDIRQAITDEATTRLNADNGLQGQIDAITSASDVVDIVGTYAELQAYDTQHLKDNDVVKVLQDETHNDAMTYWRWSTHTQTWTYIGAEGPYYTKSETNTLLDEKLDTDEVPDGFFDGPATITPTDGTIVEIKGGLKLKSISLKGNTTQQTFSGKNLFYGKPGGSSSGGITATWNGNTVVFSGEATSSYSNITASNYITFPAGTYTFSINQSSSSFASVLRFNYGGTNHDYTITKNSTSITFTLPETGTLRIVYISGLASGAEISGTYSYQLEAGSTPTSIEPYVGGTPSPNPDYPQTVNVVTGAQTIQVAGKNLLNPALFDGITTGSNSGYVTTAYYTTTTAVVFNLKPNTDYTLSFRDSDNNLSVTGFSVEVDGSWKSMSSGTLKITTNNVGQFILKIGASSYGNVGNYERFIQLEEGSTATAYEAYQGKSYSIDLGVIELCKIGDKQDYIYKSGDDWYVHKETGITTDTVGSTNITIAGMVNNGGIYSYCGGTVNGTTVTYTSALVVANTIYYQLATPTDTKITDQILISQLNSLLNATLYQNTTMICNGSLPAILSVIAFTNNLNSILEISAEPENNVFTGTDGVIAGTAGLVPAPTASDDDKYLKSDGTWASVSGGGSITPVQTTGTSQTDVMSQNAVSSMVFADPGNDTKIKIGSGASVSVQNYNMAIGYNANANGLSAVAIGYGAGARANATAIGAQAKAGTATAHNSTVAIGYNAQAKAVGSIAIGRDSSTASQGEINVGSSNTSYGYSSSNYRLISGVYDGQGSHDAVTVGQVNDTIDAINTALGTSIPHIGA